MTRSISLEIFAQVASRIVCSLFGLVLVTQLCRYVSVEDFGVYTLAFSVLAFFSPVVDIGLNTIAIREVSKAPERRAEILSSAFLLKLFMAVISFSAAGLFAGWMGEDAFQAVVIVLASFGLFNLVLNTLDVLLIVSHRMVVWGAVQVLASLLGLGGVMLLIWSGHDLSFIVLAQVGATFVVYLCVLPFFRSEWRFCRPSRSLLMFMLRETLPQGMAGIVTAYYFNVDMLMVAKMVGTEGVAFYGASYRLLNLMVFVPHAVMMTFMPILTRAFQAGPEKMNRVFSYVFQLMLFVAVPIALWAGWYAEEVISWVYTDAYLAAASSLILLVWAGVGVFVSHLSGYALVILGRQKTGMLISVLSLGLNVVLNLFLIRYWGIVGAALATLVTEFIVVLVGYLMCYHYYKLLPLSRLLWRSVALSAGVLAVLAVGGEATIVSSLVIALLVGVSLYCSLRGRDMRLLNEFMR